MTTTTDAPEPDDLPDEVKDAIESARLLAEVRAAEAKAAQLSSSTDIVKADIRGEAVREQFLAHKRLVVEAKREVEEKVAEFRNHMEVVQNKARQLMWDAERQLKPLQEQVERMNEGVWSISLYLGVGEEAIPIMGGKIAEPGTPITIRQGTLAMDEESLLFAEEGDFGEDIQDVDKFHDWLAEHPERIDALLPEQRGIIAIMPTRKGMGGDPWAKGKSGFENQTWFLLRNGERVYRILAADFSVGPRMLPTQDEFTSFFTTKRFNSTTGEHETVQLQPGTREWEEAEKGADARARHYMRVALLIQGVLDRTNVFEGVPAGLSALDQHSYDSGDIVLLADAENQLTTGRPSFTDWQQDLMARLSPGMRIIGAWNASGLRGYQSERDYNSNSRITPNGAEYPPDRPLVVAAAGAGFKATYERTQQYWFENEWGRSELRAPKTGASIKISRGDGWVIPIDLITAEEIDYYVNARSQRGEYRNLIPLLLKARDILRDEAEQEAPFRAAIAQAIVAADGTDYDEAVAAADDLVRWWKFGNKWHRPLVSDDAEFLAKATRRILAEHKARRRAGATTEGAVDRLRTEHPGAVAIYRRHSGQHVVYVPETRRYDGTPTDVFVAQHDGKTEKRWATLRASALSRMTEVWAADEWAAWQRDPARHLTDDEIDQVVATLRAATPSRRVPRQIREGYTTYDQVPVEDATLIAVDLYRKGDNASTTAATSAMAWYAYPGMLDDTDRGISIPTLGAVWKHTRTGLIVDVDGYSRSTSWEASDTSAPWVGKYRGTQIVRDDDAIAPLAAKHVEMAEVVRQEKVLSTRRWSLSHPLETHFETKAREDAKAAYVEKFGDESMYETWLQRHPIPQVRLSAELREGLAALVPAWDAPQVVDANLAIVAPTAPERDELSRLRLTEPPLGSTRFDKAKVVTVGG